jgi:hypothetical protein
MTNPLRGNLLFPLTFKLPCGDSVDLPRYRCLFRPWQGQPISDTYGGKAVLHFEGCPVFPELAILESLQGAVSHCLTRNVTRGRSLPHLKCYR